MNPFKAIGSLFVKLFNLFKSDKLAAALERVKQLAEAALPVIEYIASLTPTRIDEEIIALFKRFALPNVDKYLALPANERGQALMDAAISAMEKKYPSAPLQEIRAAIEMALVASRNK